MSDITYNKLDYSKPVSNKSFKELLKEELSSSTNDTQKLRLSNNSLNQFLALLNTYALHYDTFKEKDQKTFLNAVMQEKYPLFDIQKKFSLHLINNLEDTAKNELHSLQKLPHNIIEPLSNERVLDFVEMELMDVCESYRKWEYGYFIAETISEYFDLEQFSKLVKVNEKVLDNVGNAIDKKGNGLDPKEKVLLLLILKAKLNKGKTNMVDYLLIANIFSEKIISLSLKMDKVNTVLKQAFNLMKSNQKKKGGQNL